MTAGIMIDNEADCLSYTSPERHGYTKPLSVTTGLHPVTTISSDSNNVTVERTIDSRCHSALISACRCLNTGDDGGDVPSWGSAIKSIRIYYYRVPVCPSDPTSGIRVLTNNQTNVLVHQIVTLLG
jgi:hypothetical protein